MNNTNIKPYGQFQLWVLNNFPFTIDDFDSITQYQMLLKCLGSIKEQIDINSDLYKKITNLENYLANLDLQDEVDQKLDEMASDGTLASIIAEYLNASAVLGYNTIEDMQSGTTFINGSICKVLGKTNALTGDGSFYKIREVLTTDVIDGENKVALTNFPSLIAEIIPNYFINELDKRIDIIEKPRKYVFAGDSYGAGYTPDGAVTGWNTVLKNILNLSNDECTILNLSGAGFNENLQYNFTQLFTNVTSDNDVTDVLIAGGYNDVNIGSNYDVINTGMSHVKTAIYTKYPNVKNIMIAFIGNTCADYGKRFNCGIVSELYSRSANALGLTYINNSEYILHDYFNQFSSDGIHPNQTGENAIANNLVNGIKTGCCNVKYLKTNIISNINTFYTTMSNNITSLTLYDNLQLNFTPVSNISCSGSNGIEIATIVGGQIFNSTANYRGLINCVFIDNSGGSNKYYDIPCYIKLIDNKLTLYPFKTNSSNANYFFLSAYAVQLRPFTLTFDSTWC